MIWSALTEARRRERSRTTFLVDGQVVGSVDDAHVAVLRRWPQAVALQADAVTLRLPRPERDAWFA